MKYRNIIVVAILFSSLKLSAQLVLGLGGECTTNELPLVGPCQRIVDQKLKNDNGDKSLDPEFDMYSSVSQRVKDVNELKKCTLLVVLRSSDTSLSRVYKNAFALYWKFTPYQFIEPSEVPLYAVKPGYAFFIFLEQEYNTEATLKKTGSGILYDKNGNPLMIMDSHGNMVPAHAPGYKVDPKTSAYHYMPDFAADRNLYTEYKYAIMLSQGKGIVDNDENHLIRNLSTVVWCWESGQPGYPSVNKPREDQEGQKSSILNMNKYSVKNLPGIVKNFNAEMEFMYQMQDEKEVTWHKGSCPVEHNGEKKTFKGVYYEYSSGVKLIKTKKLLIWDGFTDEMGMKAICNILELKPEQVQLVPKATIDSVTLSRNFNYAVLADSIHDEYHAFSIKLGGVMPVISLYPPLYTKGLFFYGDFVMIYNKNAMKPEERAKYKVD